jgi:bacteriorhodopsin
MIADILMILFGLWGAITTYHSRWGYYAIGCFWMFIVFWGLLVTGGGGREVTHSPAICKKLCC